MKAEFLDIWDEYGSPTGEVSEKNRAHQLGLFHPTVHVWFYTSSPSILMQKRGANKQTFPNLWDVSVAGHVSAGETILDAAIREVKEEIGVSVSATELLPIDVRKNTNTFENGVIDCEFQHVFLCALKTTPENLTLQKSEVEAVRLFSFEEINQCINNIHSKYKIVPADMNYYQYVMKAIISTLR